MRHLLRNLWINRPSAKRRRQREWCATLHAAGLTVRDVERLAEYNAQAAGGLLHPEDYVTWMADLQARYNRAVTNTSYSAWMADLQARYNRAVTRRAEL